MTLIQRITRKLMEAGVFWLGMLSPAFAQVPSDLTEGKDAVKPEGAPDELFGSEGIFTRIVNTIIFLVGAIAVLMLIIGGIRYVVSAGDENAVKGAKNTILYAIIGIVIAILAFAMVNFIIERLSTS